VFAARYELNSYIVFRKRLVSKRLKLFNHINTTGTLDSTGLLQIDAFDALKSMKVSLTFDLFNCYSVRFGSVRK
jgi:hypothetical protein